MSNGLVGFLTYKNKHPQSYLEAAGDLLISPVTTLFNRNSFVVLTNRQTSARCYYSHTNTSTPTWLVVVEVIAAIATLPIALLGYTLKGISLITSPETRATYFNWTPLFTPPHPNPAPIDSEEGFRQSARNNIALGLFITQRRFVPQLLEEILTHPKQYLQSTGNEVILTPLSESSQDNFNRLRRARRQRIEERIVANAERHFPNRASPFVYLDLDSGGLLQTFFNVGKLVQAGYRDLKIVLIEPNISNSPHFQFFSLFFAALATQKGILIETQSYQSIQEYRQAAPQDRVNIASAINFSQRNWLEILPLAQQILHPQGQIYYSSTTDADNLTLDHRQITERF